MSAADRLDQSMANDRTGKSWPKLIIRLRAAEEALREIAAIETHPSGATLAGATPDSTVERCRRIARRALARLDEDTTS